MADGLDALRAQIDALDSEILDSLARRAETVERVRALKSDLGREMHDPMRAASHIRDLVARSEGSLPAHVVERVFGEIHDAMLGVMRGGADRYASGPLGGARRTFSLAGTEVGRRAFWIAGPCSVESAEQISGVAADLGRLGVKMLRGGAFKPRTSPASFQGLGLRGLILLREAADANGMAVVTEAVDERSLESVVEYADVVQIGTRNAQNYALLRSAGAAGLPVLLKRGFGSTIREWLGAAEYVAAAGCDRIVLCERGIRTFETETRATLDISSVPVVRELAGLPVVVDVSHAAGRKDILVDLSRASFAVGAAGVMVEVHPNPPAALSDGQQQLTPLEFAAAASDVAASVERAP